MNFLDKDIKKSVFISSVVIILILTLASCIYPKYIGDSCLTFQNSISENLGWFFIFSVGLILIISFVLAFSKFGNIKLGANDSKPEFSNLSWFSMLFSAGMGIGLMFWGVSEPIIHFINPPIPDKNTINVAKDAIKISFFHWGINVWGIYSLFAVMLSYFGYRKNLPLLPRSILYPIIDEKIHGRIGDYVDIFAILGTLFGMCTSMGLGAMQINAGLSYLFPIPQNLYVQIIIIALVTFLATISLVCGLEKGIKNLSNINIILAFLLMSLILVLGDTVNLLSYFIQNLAEYFSDIIYRTFNMYAYRKDNNWISNWTLPYWAWWLSWAPFVAMFIARISKGRTIREFMVGVLFAPSLFTLLWMTIFGNSALGIIARGDGKELIESATSNIPIVLFQFLNNFEFSLALQIISIVLIITFFVSSSDSASYVIDTISFGGNSKNKKSYKIFWSVSAGVLASSLLIAGGLKTLQTITIIGSLPILIIMIVGTYGFIKSLRKEFKK